MCTSRRTTRRYFLFVPDAQGKTEAIFWYCLAVTANKHGILVHAAQLMTNHVHLVFTDVHGVAPNFFRDFHRLLAECIKVHLGWPEEVFNKAKTSEHEPVTVGAIIDRLAYAIANPPLAGLVRRAAEWPGAHTTAHDMGRRMIRARRPDVFFTDPSWPEEEELEISLPPALIAEMEPDEIRRRVAERVRHYEREALAKSKNKGLSFLGARRAQRVRHTDRASSWEDFGARNRRFSAAGDAEAARGAAERNGKFDADYDEALAAWQAGDRDVEFPYGTWWMRVHHNVRVRPPP